MSAAVVTGGDPGRRQPIEHADTAVELAGIGLPSPVLTASGCAAAGRELDEFFDIEETEEENHTVKMDTPLVKADKLDVPCVRCGEKILYEHQSNTIQGELKRFLQQQDAGLDCSFRCCVYVYDARGTSRNNQTKCSD